MNVMPDIIFIGQSSCEEYKPSENYKTKMSCQQLYSNPIPTRLQAYEATALSTYPDINAFECVI